MDNQFIWIVSTGSYSDYTVHAAFDSQEKAEEFVKNSLFHSDFNTSDVRVGQLPLNPFKITVPDGYHVFSVFMRRDGEVIFTDLCEDSFKYLMKVWSIGFSDGCMESYVLAIDAEHAIKIVNERRVSVIAANAWPEAT